MKITSFKSQLCRAIVAVTICGIALAVPAVSKAQASYTINGDTAGSFLSANAPSSNFGAAGTFAIAGATDPKGEFDSILMFNTAGAVANFNGLYGLGNWAITGLSLSLASNFPTQGESINNPIFNNINGGAFGVDWVGNNSWSGGGGGGMGGPGYPGTNSVSFNYIPLLMTNGVDSLGVFNYVPPGNPNYLTYNLPLDGNLVSGSAAGGEVSLYFYAPTNSQISYLFNSEIFGSNHPEFTLTATVVPEPATLALFAAAFGGLLTSRRHLKS